jgi:arylsulfatase
VDTLRADHLGCYGYFRETSPTLDALAGESVVFEWCLSPIATTLPAHASLFTGTYPLEHGILANIRHGGSRFEPSPHLRSAAEFAREAGYRTAAFVSAAPVKRETGIAAGFETFDEPEGYDRPAGETNERVLAWLRERVATPFFLWVHYFDPHYRYEPPEPFDELFRSDGALEAHLAERGFAESSSNALGESMTARDAVNAYDGEVRYVDRELGRLLATLREQGLWQDTVLVLVGDHGEGLGQHAQLGHGCIYGEQLRVPAMIRAPGLPPRRVPWLVSLVDILPTALALIGSDIWNAFLEQGSGLDALDPSVARIRPLLAQRSMRESRARECPPFALTTPEWKLLVEPGGGQKLFHRPTDPHELRDVSADHPSVVEELQGELQAEIDRQRAVGARLGEGRDASAEAMSPELLEQLRSLGYVD